MRRILVIIICVIVSIAGCSSTPINTDSIEPTLVSRDLPKNIEAFALKWMDDDKLIYHSDKGLFAYSPSTNTTKTLLLEEPRGNYLAWVGYPLYSWYFGVSPDKSKYLMATGERYTLEIRESKTNAVIFSFFFKDQIKESGWVNNDKVFLTTKYSLFIINITAGEQIQVTEDSTEVFAKATPNIQEPYIKWAEVVCNIDEKLYYNGVRGPNDLISSSIYRGDELGEQKVLDKAILQLRVDDRSFVYIKQSESGYDGYYLYDVNTKKSILITEEELINTGGIHLTNDNKLAFMIDTSTKGVYEGEIFDPLTLKSQKYKMTKKDFEDSDLLHRQFGRLMGAFEKDGEYIFLFNVRDTNKCMSFNTKINIISELKGYENRIGINSIANMYISPTGNYTAITSNYKLFDVVTSESLLPLTQ